MLIKKHKQTVLIRVQNAYAAKLIWNFSWDSSFRNLISEFIIATLIKNNPSLLHLQCWTPTDNIIMRYDAFWLNYHKGKA